MSLILRNLVSRIQRCPCRISSFSTIADNNIEQPSKKVEPIISTKEYPYDDSLYQKRREVWLENLDTVKMKKLGLVSLHPDVFAMKPRMDILWENVRWQKMYQQVVRTRNYSFSFILSKSRTFQSRNCFTELRSRKNASGKERRRT